MSIAQIAVPDLDAELATTRKVIERIPEDQFTWKPHDKSFSLGSLAAHVAGLVTFQHLIITRDGIDVSEVPRDPQPTRAGLLKTLDQQATNVKTALAQVTDADLTRPWTMTFGEHTVFTMPKGTALRIAGINHMVHHRAQLGVYLRMLNVAVPGSYGPTADER